MSTPAETNVQQIAAASVGFDHLFSNQVVEARETFSADVSPFHLLGLGVCAFLEAALGMERGHMTEANRCLALSEAGAKKQTKTAKSKGGTRFPAGLEWEILNADAVVLLGLMHALSESYMGYLQCMYSLNNAHSKFSKLYNTVFPEGLDNFATPSTTPAVSRKPSTQTLRSSAASSTKSGFLGRWGSGSTLKVPAADAVMAPDGPVEELIIAGTAFGFGLFNLVFSLLPAAVKNVVGWLGFKSDRKLALQALGVAATRNDVHASFAGLVLMTYHGVVLLMSGYQADEAHIIKQYKAIVDKIEGKYPTGALWILNRAKILRMAGDPLNAIRVLQEGLSPEKPHSFKQADTLLVFELAWTLLGQRKFQEAADAFMKVTELNSWSHATYYFIAAGCYVSVGNRKKAQELLDVVPPMLEPTKAGGKKLPTEVFIERKLAFYKAKQKRRGGDEKNFVEAISITPAEEMGLFWNNHSRIGKTVAEEYIQEWMTLTPATTVSSPYTITSPAVAQPHLDLDTPDELAIRSLLLGITHRTAEQYAASREFLSQAAKMQKDIKTSTWVGGVAMFELAVLELKDLEATGDAASREDWRKALTKASGFLDQALELATGTVDLSSRLDSRIMMLKEQIATKKEMIGTA